MTSVENAIRSERLAMNNAHALRVAHARWRASGAPAIITAMLEKAERDAWIEVKKAIGRVVEAQDNNQN